MKFTKKEVNDIKHWFPKMKELMVSEDTRYNLIMYGIYAGRMIQILRKRTNLDKPEGTDDYIKKTFGEKIFSWYAKDHQEHTINKKLLDCIGKHIQSKENK